MKCYIKLQQDAVRNAKEMLENKRETKRGGSKGASVEVRYVVPGDDSMFEINGEMYWKESEVKAMLDLAGDSILDLEEQKTINEELLSLYNKAISENALLKDKVQSLKNLSLAIKEK